MKSATKVLIVVTSHGDINDVPTTGIWFSEFAEPYAVLEQADYDVTVASPRGGPSPVDPRGYPGREEIGDARDALARLNATARLSAQNAVDYDALFLPGGHGPMFDLATDPTLKRLVADFWAGGKPVGAICHGVAGLLGVTLAGGETLLRGRRVTGFSRGEDALDSLFAFMPFSLQERAQWEGADFIEGPEHQPHVVVDGLLVTGQNPASARSATEVFLGVLTAGTTSA
jgi:putative intracellular protease/amidase